MRLLGLLLFLTLPRTAVAQYFSQPYFDEADALHHAHTLDSTVGERFFRRL